MSVLDIDLKLTGGDQAARELDKVKEKAKQLKDLSKGTGSGPQNITESAGFGAIGALAGGALGSAVASQISALVASVAQGVSSYNEAVSHFKQIDFKDAKAEFLALDTSITRLSLHGIEGSDRLHGKVDEVSKGILVGADRVVQAATMLSDTTYGQEGMTDAVAAAGTAANKSGRQLEQLLPLAATLGKAFGASGQQITSGFEKIEDLSQSLGTTGGVRAFQDTIAGLGNQFQQLSVQTDQSRNKALAFVGVITQGLNKDQAQRVGGQALGAIEGVNPLTLSRTLHKSVKELYDEQGHLRDPAANYQALKEKTIRRFGKEKALDVLVNTFGTEVGSQIYYKDLTQVDALAKEKPLQQEPQLDYTQTAAGKRELFEIEHQKQARDDVAKGLADESEKRRLALMNTPGGMADLVKKEKNANYLPGFVNTALSWFRPSGDTQLEDLRSDFKNKGRAYQQATPAQRAEFERTGRTPADTQAAREASVPDRGRLADIAHPPADYFNEKLGPFTQVNSNLKKLLEKMPTAQQNAAALTTVMQTAKFQVKAPLPTTKAANDHNKQAGDVNR